MSRAFPLSIWQVARQSPSCCFALCAFASTPLEPKIYKGVSGEGGSSAAQLSRSSVAFYAGNFMAQSKREKVVISRRPPLGARGASGALEVAQRRRQYSVRLIQCLLDCWKIANCPFPSCVFAVDCLGAKASQSSDVSVTLWSDCDRWLGAGRSGSGTTGNERRQREECSAVRTGVRERRNSNE